MAWCRNPGREGNRSVLEGEGRCVGVGLGRTQHPWWGHLTAPAVPPQHSHSYPSITGTVPNLVLNVGMDPLQHPLAGVLVRQVRVHLCRGRARHCSKTQAKPCPAPPLAAAPRGTEAHGMFPIPSPPQHLCSQNAKQGWDAFPIIGAFPTANQVGDAPALHPPSGRETWSEVILLLIEFISLP